MSGFSGRERVVDLNGDGLPEILEHAIGISPDEAHLPEPTLHRDINTFVNNGYGWTRRFGIEVTSMHHIHSTLLNQVGYRL